MSVAVPLISLLRMLCCLYHLFSLEHLLCIVNCFFHVPRRSKTACNEIEWCHLENFGQTLHQIPRGGTTSVKLSQLRTKSWGSGQHTGSKCWILTKLCWVQVTETDSTLVISRGLVGVIVQLLTASTQGPPHWTLLSNKSTMCLLLLWLCLMFKWSEERNLTLLHSGHGPTHSLGHWWWNSVLPAH